MAWRKNFQSDSPPLYGEVVYSIKDQYFYKNLWVNVDRGIDAQWYITQEACETAIKRIVAKQADFNEFQIGFLAVNRNGEYGAYSIKNGFQYAVAVDGQNKLYNSDYYMK